MNPSSYKTLERWVRGDPRDEPVESRGIKVLQVLGLAFEHKISKSGEGSARRRRQMWACSVGGESREMQGKVKVFEPCRCREAIGHRLW
jgi:hypothetical protein